MDMENVIALFDNEVTALECGLMKGYDGLFYDKTEYTKIIAMKKKREEEKIENKKEEERDSIIKAETAQSIMSEDEKELYYIFDKATEKELSSPYILPRDFEEIRSVGITCEYLWLWLKSKPKFNEKCTFEYKRPTIFPEGFSYVVSNTSTKNSIIILSNGFLFVDTMNDFSTCTKSFERYLNLLRRDWSTDLSKGIAQFKKDRTHNLAKYFFVPFLKGGIIKLKIPPLRDYPTIRVTTLAKFIRGTLGIRT